MILGNKKMRKALLMAASVAALAATTGGASATEGYFSKGFGAVQQGLAGTGVANTSDAMSLALNPAGLVNAGHQFQGGISLFMPYRGYNATGTAFIAPGNVNSNGNIFAIPNLAYARPIDAVSAWGIAMFGNGGMNTSYAPMARNPLVCGPGNGVFCGGKAGVDLMQAFITVGYARRMGNVSFGIAPIIALQRFSARGLGAFAGFSSDPLNLTNKGNDYSAGIGLRGGVQMAVTNSIRLGLAVQTPIWMSPFSSYRGLFAERGDFDIPANVTAGVSVDLTPAFTVTLDYKHIWYRGVASVSNLSTNMAPLGTPNGPGFGWKNVNVLGVGLEWRASDALTLRAGYAYNNNPVRSGDMVFNILAPGVVKHHITAGLSYKFTKNLSLDLAGIYVPETKIAGPEILPTPFGPFAVPGSRIELKMHQYQVTAGLTYKFDVAPPPIAPVVRKY
jgi:long-chain fatty acid transport protein